MNNEETISFSADQYGKCIVTTITGDAVCISKVVDTFIHFMNQFCGYNTAHLIIETCERYIEENKIVDLREQLND